MLQGMPYGLHSSKPAHSTSGLSTGIPTSKRHLKGEFKYVLFLMRDVICELQLIDTDAAISGSDAQDGERMYLLLPRYEGREVLGQTMLCHLLLFYVKDGLAVRGTVVILVIPEERLELLQDLKPRIRHVDLTRNRAKISEADMNLFVDLKSLMA